MIDASQVPRPSNAITPKLAGLEDDAMPSSEEGVPVTYLAGEGWLVGKLIGSIYNQRAVEAKDPRPGKK